MDVTLAKFIAILAFCEIISCVSGIPIKDTAGYDPRDKRSPSDNNFSLFGFGIKTPFSVPDPITSVHDSYKNLANLFRPAPDLSRNGNNNRKQHYNEPQQQNEINNKKFIFNKPDQVLAPHKGNATKNNELILPPSINHNNKPEVLAENVNYSRGNHVVEENNGTKINTKLVSKAVANETSAEITVASYTETTTKIVSLEDEKKLLDYIFNNSENTLDSTTADTTETGNYTTETSDYNSTTIEDSDDLLRIPSQVVASLLG